MKLFVSILLVVILTVNCQSEAEFKEWCSKEITPAQEKSFECEGKNTDVSET